jgi:hypothetical protein
VRENPFCAPITNGVLADAEDLRRGERTDLRGTGHEFVQSSERLRLPARTRLKPFRAELRQPRYQQVDTLVAVQPEVLDRFGESHQRGRSVDQRS